jgi:hypothetical protein
VTTLPLSTLTSARAKFTSSATMEAHHCPVPTAPVTKSTPPMSNPLMARTQNMASIDLRPSSVQ